MRIDCAQFEEIVHELERPGTQGFEMREEAVAHAESCERCGALLAKAMALDLALDTLAIEDRGEQAPERMETALLAEFRRQHARTPRPQRSLRLAAALAMAAALILAIGFSVRHGVAHERTPGHAEVAANTVPKANAGANAPTAAEEDSAASDSGMATNFVALPFATDPVTLEGGTVVRVTLSRAALASFGMPSAGLSSTDRIPADIALSEDGVPQAIRLVADANLDQPD